MADEDSGTHQIITIEEFMRGGYITLREFAKTTGRNLSGVRGMAFRGALPVVRVIGPNGIFRAITRQTALTFQFPKEGRPPVSARLLEVQRQKEPANA